MKLSIILPGIRTNGWAPAYHSTNINVPFEFIIVSPYPLPSELNFENVKHVQDYGSPVRCANIGLSLCEGEIVTWMADDAIYLPGMLQKTVDMLTAMPDNLKNVVLFSYSEGSPNLNDISYYKLCNAYPRVRHVQDHWWIFNATVMKTEYLRQLGGWDSQFETPALSHADLAVRAQKDGCVTYFLHEIVAHVTHGHPDHKPIEHGHVQHDVPLYVAIHNDPNNDGRINIDVNNWKNSPAVWSRRFG